VETELDKGKQSKSKNKPLTSTGLQGQRLSGYYSKYSGILPWFQIVIG